MERLERELECGPLAHGWLDQRWTLARIKVLIGRLFRISYTVEGTWLLLKRHGWSWQQPARRAIQRDDDAVEMWKGSAAGEAAVCPEGHVLFKPGSRLRLIYGLREYRGRKDEPKGFGWHDFCRLLVRARIQLGGPIVLVWDNVRLHLTRGMRAFIDRNSDWLTVFQLPTRRSDETATQTEVVGHDMPLSPQAPFFPPP